MILLKFSSRILKFVFLEISFYKKKETCITIYRRSLLYCFDVRRSLCKHLHLGNFWSGKLASPYLPRCWSARSFLFRNTLHCRYKLKRHDQLWRFYVSKFLEAFRHLVCLATLRIKRVAEIAILKIVRLNNSWDFKILIFNRCFYSFKR